MKTILYLASVAVVFSLSFQSACAQNPPASPSVGPVAGQPWTNSLGVKFVPAGTDGVLFSVWDVRVKDFKAFVDATGYDATKGMVSLDSDGWKARGDTWKSPGFAQTDDHPVVGVNLIDAKAFCVWLTKKEQAEGKLGANQRYRLPSDAEWSKAVGLNESSEGTPQSKGLSKSFEMVYPWGKGWPPPKGAGNYAGSEAKDAKWFSRNPTIAGYDDGYPRTSPVGSFPANSYGLYDMGGNVWQWCDDKYINRGQYQGCMVQRGCSWVNYNWDYLLSIYRNYIGADFRASCFGMRVVVALNRQAEEEAAMAKARNACVERTAQREAEAKAKPAPANTVVVVNATDMSRQGGGAVENKVASKRGAVGLVFTSWDAVGHWIEWTFTVPAEGYYNLTVCYCSQDNVGERTITINGAEQEPFAPLLLPVTGGWSNGSDNWHLGTAVNPTTDKPLLLKLKQGANVIRLNNSNGKRANLNYVAVTSPDVAITRELLASKAPPGVPPPPQSEKKP